MFAVIDVDKNSACLGEVAKEKFEIENSLVSLSPGPDDVSTPVTQNSTTCLPRKPNGDTSVPTITVEADVVDNYLHQTEDEDAVGADAAPASTSQPLPDKVHLVSSSFISNRTSSEEPVEPLKQKVIPLPVPSSISSIIQSGLAPTTYFDDSWSSKTSVLDPDKDLMGNKVIVTSKDEKVTDHQNAVTGDQVDKGQSKHILTSSKNISPTIVDIEEGASRIAVTVEVNANVKESNENDNCSSKVPNVTKIATNLKTSNNANVSSDIQTRNLDTNINSLDTDNDTNNESAMITIITTSSNNPETLSPQSLISSSVPSVVGLSSGPSITSEEITSNINLRSGPLLPNNENNYNKRVTVKSENMLEPESCEGLTEDGEACANARETPRQITSLHDITIDHEHADDDPNDELTKTSTTPYATVQQLRKMFATNCNDLKVDTKKIVENEDQSTTRLHSSEDQLTQKKIQQEGMLGVDKSDMNNVICTTDNQQTDAPAAAVTNVHDNLKNRDDTNLATSKYGEMELNKESFLTNMSDTNITNDNHKHLINEVTVNFVNNNNEANVLEDEDLVTNSETKEDNYLNGGKVFGDNSPGYEIMCHHGVNTPGQVEDIPDILDNNPVCDVIQNGNKKIRKTGLVEKIDGGSCHGKMSQNLSNIAAQMNKNCDSLQPAENCSNIDPAADRLYAEVRIVAKNCESQNSSGPDCIESGLSDVESSDDSSMSSTFNEYSATYQPSRPHLHQDDDGWRVKNDDRAAGLQANDISDWQTPFSTSSSSGATDAEYVPQSGHYLARLDLDPDHCIQLSSLPEMFVDEDVAATLSDVSPISDYDASITNLPLDPPLPSTTQTCDNQIKCDKLENFGQKQNENKFENCENENLMTKHGVLEPTDNVEDINHHPNETSDRDNEYNQNDEKTPVSFLLGGLNTKSPPTRKELII